MSGPTKEQNLAQGLQYLYPTGVLAGPGGAKGSRNGSYKRLCPPTEAFWGLGERDDVVYRPGRQSLFRSCSASRADPEG